VRLGRGPEGADPLVARLQRRAARYFLDEVHPDTGLVADSNQPGAPCSIAAVGMALGVHPIAVRLGLLGRDEAARRSLRLLRFFRDGPQNAGAEATGFRGFYYHFLDMATGRRTRGSELSTIDTALLLAGVLAAASYFDHEAPEEQEVRTIADALYRRVDWRWALDGEPTLSHGWRPGEGFIPYRWEGYNEALILYLLALGSPTHPIPPESYTAWTRSYSWERIYGREVLYAGPLFLHQYSHLWIDFLGIQDAFMREKGIDYFENSRRATLVQQEYAIRNPLGFAAYCDCCWGLTAAHGPGPATFVINGTERNFLGYAARGAPHGPDDGTIAPWCAAASLPFAPEVVLPTLRRFDGLHVGAHSPYAFESTFNPTYPTPDGGPIGWVCPWVFGIDQGALALMFENYRTGLIWKLIRRVPYVRTGLHRAGFDGGWLTTANPEA
jgi:hypothetical protein